MKVSDLSPLCEEFETFWENMMREILRTRKNKKMRGHAALAPHSFADIRPYIEKVLRSYVNSRMVTKAYMRKSKKGLWITFLWEGT